MGKQQQKNIRTSGWLNASNAMFTGDNIKGEISIVKRQNIFVQL